MGSFDAVLHVRMPHNEANLPISIGELCEEVSQALCHIDAPVIVALQRYEQFFIVIRENKPGYGPWYVYTLDWDRDWYFQYSIFFRFRSEDFDANLQPIKKLLAHFWEKGYPATVKSEELDPEEGYEAHLPMQGGNDLDQVFWREDHLAFRKKAGLESYLGPPIND